MIVINFTTEPLLLDRDQERHAQQLLVDKRITKPESLAAYFSGPVYAEKKRRDPRFSRIDKIAAYACNALDREAGPGQALLFKKADHDGDRECLRHLFRTLNANGIWTAPADILPPYSIGGHDLFSWKLPYLAQRSALLGLSPYPDSLMGDFAMSTMRPPVPIFGLDPLDTPIYDISTHWTRSKYASTDLNEIAFRVGVDRSALRLEDEVLTDCRVAAQLISRIHPYY